LKAVTVGAYIPLNRAFFFVSELMMSFRKKVVLPVASKNYGKENATYTAPCADR